MRRTHTWVRMPNSEKRYGIFTERQRKYLQGELDELNPGDERALRGKIRARVDTLFAELTLLPNISETDREQIFEERVVFGEGDIEVEAGQIDSGVLKRDVKRMESGSGFAMGVGLGHLLQFAYTGLREQGYSPDHFGTLIKFYIKRAEQALGDDRLYDDISVEFSVDTVSTVDLETAKEKRERGEELSAVELKALVDSGALVVSEA